MADLELDTLEGAITVIETFKPMIESKAWALFKELLEKQVVARKATVILSPLGPEPGAVYAQEYMKGEIAGIRTMASVVETLVETAIVAKKQFEDEEHAAGRDENGSEDNE